MFNERRKNEVMKERKDEMGEDGSNFEYTVSTSHCVLIGSFISVYMQRKRKRDLYI